MRTLRKLLVIAMVGFGVYAAALAILGFALEGFVASRASARLAAALGAEVEVGSTSVSLLRGTVLLRNIHAERKDGGHLQLAIEEARADIAPLGWVAVNNVPDHVRVSGVSMSLSAAGALGLPARPERPPLALGGLSIRDAGITLLPTAVFPGLGRLDLRVEEAHTGRVDIRSAIDWVFALREIDATVHLGGESTLGARYAGGKLTVQGSLFGSSPVTVPFALPAPDPGALELDKLRVLAQALIRALGVHASRSFIERNIKDRVLDLID